jgi:hypothetical protein
VAERRNSTPQSLRHEYCFDRLLVEKLVQAYDLLVPDKQWAVGQPTEPKEAVNAQADSDLCARFLGSSERESPRADEHAIRDTLRSRKPGSLRAMPSQFETSCAI